MKKFTLMLCMFALAVSCNEKQENDGLSSFNHQKSSNSSLLYFDDLGKDEWVLSYQRSDSILDVMRGSSSNDFISWQKFIVGTMLSSVDVLLGYEDVSTLSISYDEKQKSYRLTNRDGDDVFISNITSGKEDDMVTFECSSPNSKLVLPFSIQHSSITKASLIDVLTKNDSLQNPFALTSTKVVISAGIVVAIGIFVATIAYSEIDKACDRKIYNDIVACKRKGKCAIKHRCRAECISCK